MSAVKTFFSKYKTDAQKATVGSKIFPETVLSAGALESALGKSVLAARYNNFFGVKASKNWKGKVISLPTVEYLNGKKVTLNQNFRWYDSPADSFADYVRLVSSPRYVRAGVTSAKTPQKQMEAIHAAGYATDPSYSAKLKSILKSSGFKMAVSGVAIAALIIGFIILTK